MTSLVEFKQVIKRIYVRYEMWITPVWKFLLAFIALSAINDKVGYLAALKPTPVVLMAALLCSIMPPGFLTLVASAFILGHFYAVSIETLGVGLVFFLLMFLLYFRFGPGDTVVLVLTPLMFMRHIPYLMPLSLGLVSTPVSAMAVACGVFVYYLLSYVRANAAALGAGSFLGGGGDTEVIVQLRTFLTGFITNHSMWVMAGAFAVVLVVVWLIRRLSINHSWKIAILVGSVLNIVLLLIGDFIYDIKLEFFGVFLGTVVSALICFVLEFLFFHLDYSRTERVQFEDDDYYYYVKAVPKVAMAATERKVKKINRAHNSTQRSASRSSSDEYEYDEDEDDDDEDEVLRERVPMRSQISSGYAEGSSRGSTARVPLRMPEPPRTSVGHTGRAGSTPSLHTGIGTRPTSSYAAQSGLRTNTLRGTSEALRTTPPRRTVSDTRGLSRNTGLPRDRVIRTDRDNT